MGIFIIIIFAFVAGVCFGFMLGVSRTMREAASQSHGTRRPIIAWVVIGLGCAVLIGAFGTMLYSWHFIRVAQRTSGTVIEMREHAGKDSGDISYAPTFRFQDASGASYTVSSSIFSAPPEFHVGDTVPVLYLHDDTRNAKIDSYWQVWMMPSLLGIIGGIDLPVGLIILFWPKIIGRFRGRTPNQQAA
jgi:hypothetical protein